MCRIPVHPPSFPPSARKLVHQLERRSIGHVGLAGSGPKGGASPRTPDRNRTRRHSRGRPGKATTGQGLALTAGTSTTRPEPEAVIPITESDVLREAGRVNGEIGSRGCALVARRERG